MRIAFLIMRKNYYRLLGPAVEEALGRGLEVECWHDWSHPRAGGKASEFPDAPPSFAHRAPAARSFQGIADLADRWRAEAPDVVVSLDPPHPELRAAGKPRWVWLQFSADILFYRTPQGILDADAVGTYSAYWIERLAERHAATGLADEVRRKARAVGVPEHDALRRIDPLEVRRRLGLPPERPVVLYLPFPLRSNPRTFWLRHVYSPSTRLGQAARTMVGRRWGYWPHVRAGWNDRGLVERLRTFCDREGALLVMKAREKDPVPRYARRLADRVLYDACVYPPTILECLSVASLCVHFYSTAAFEAAAAGVPGLCLAPDAADMGLPAFVHDLVHHGRLGGIYNWPGVSYCAPLRDAWSGLERWRLADFPLDPDARRGYVERFLGPDDGRSAGRLLDLACELGEGSGR